GSTSRVVWPKKFLAANVIVVMLMSTKPERCSRNEWGAQPPRLLFGAPSRRTPARTNAVISERVCVCRVGREGAVHSARGGRAPQEHCMVGLAEKLISKKIDDLLRRSCPDPNPNQKLKNS